VNGTRLAWYGKRLRAMTPAEAADRVRRTLGHRTDAALYVAAPRLWRRRWEPEARSLLTSELGAAPLGLLVAERAVGVRDRFPHECMALLERANALLEGRFQFFGYPETAVEDLGADVDPFSGRAWPRKHGKRIDYRRAWPSDPKWIWELNRCQDLPLLVAAWLLSDESRYAEFAAKRLASWIEAHPPGRGIAWSNGFEAGIRAISMSVAFDGLRGSEHLTRARGEQIARALCQSVRWIARDQSTGSSANNHRVGELAGVVAVATLLPELDGSGNMLERALEELGDEAERQIRPDGTGAEQAFAYHVFVLDLLLVIVALLDARDLHAPESLCTALTRSADALWAQMGNDEPEPTYGDADDGRALVLDAAALRTGRGVAAAIAARFGHRRAASVAGGLDPMCLWLFGTEGAERFEAAARAGAAAPESLTLANGGLSILRGGGSRTLFDHGPHGYLSLAAHGHADALGIDLAHHGHPLVSDPGVGSYFARPEVREAFRATGLHATVTVDGLSSSERGGAFLWTRHARSTLLHFDPAGAAIAEHDGYARLVDPVVHRRAVVLVGNDGALLVVDRLQAAGWHRYSQRWPFHPTLDVESQGAQHILIRGEHAGVLLLFSAPAEFDVRLARGEESPLLGWWSDRLESVVPSWLASVDVDAEGTVEMAALAIPFFGDAPDIDDFGLSLESRSVSSLVTVGRGGDAIELDLGSSQPSIRRVASAGAL
jgi:uncharacterized heparinase superfamily protein